MRFIKLKLKRYDEKAEYEKQKNELKIESMFENQDVTNTIIQNPNQQQEDEDEDEEENGNRNEKEGDPEDAYFPRQSFDLQEPETPDVYYK